MIMELIFIDFIIIGFRKVFKLLCNEGCIYYCDCSFDLKIGL